VKGKAQEPLEASGSLATTGTELVVPSRQEREQGKTADVRMIDCTNEHSNGRDKILSGKATGPRTELGKQRSSRNAIRHGIFSEAILLKGESRAQFVSLRTELWEALRPEGRLEELLVDKLASISWRYRRFLLAETGEIRKQFLEWNEKRNEDNDEVADSLHDEDRLIANIQDRDVLKRCLELLGELREEIETTGFQRERDTSILEKIYGTNTYSRDRLRDDYSAWFETAQVSEEERVRERYANPEECKQNVLDAIDDEIRRLKCHHKKTVSIEAQRTEIELLRCNVPESPWLDRVLRYEASLERAFDRTLGQLERLQRLRQGQPVAPRLDVTISG
jgi:hypothetical protein